MRFQKIPHKERMRHIKYRQQQWDRDEERHEREIIRQMIAEKEAAMRHPDSEDYCEKERENRELLKRLGLLEE